MGEEILEQVVERWPMGEDGRSGGRLERVRLADGTKLVVKRTGAAYDFAAQLTGDAGREARLFLSGTLDRLPNGVAHAVLDAWPDGDEWVIVMRDVSEGLVPNEHIATADEIDRVLTALSALHHAYAGHAPPGGLCPLPAVLSILFPKSMESAQGERSFAELVLRGWDRFHEMVPPEVSSGVAAIHEDPESFAARLVEFPSTLLHGDFWLANCSLMPDEVVLFDWSFATWGPPAVELAIFLSGHGARMEPSREDALQRFAELSGGFHHPGATRLALAHGLALMGWNKALDATEHADSATRARERADLDWWIGRFDPS